MRVACDGDLSGLALLAWLSPSFPVGAFAYSHGIETAIDLGIIFDADTLQDWLIDLLAHGSARNDAVLVAAAWSASQARDPVLLREVNDLAMAISPSRERRLETAAMGTAFATIIRAAWPLAFDAQLPDGDIAYPVAFGSACATAGLRLAPSLDGFVLAFVQNLVSAALRLGPIGQTDGQKLMAALMPSIRRCATFAERSTLDDLGGCAQRSDLAAMRHETLYSRLFRS